MQIKCNHYDLVINATESSSSGRMFTKASQAKVKIFDQENLQKKSPDDFIHIAKHQIYQLRECVK